MVMPKKSPKKKKESKIEHQHAAIGIHFATIDDPRLDRTQEHNLLDIIIIAICAVICGANHWTEVAVFGQAKESWLRTFLSLPGGIPSHDTFGRVFAKLDPTQFQTSFLNWVKASRKKLNQEVVAIDGKALRRSHDEGIGKSAIHMVSAWATKNRLVLGQRKVDEKSNEITAIPELLDSLTLAGCIITIDAMGCQTKIAQKIVTKEADYLLSLKKNQSNLYEDAEEAFAYGLETKFKTLNYDYCKTTNKGHDRIEIRECWAMPVADWSEHIRNIDAWANLNTMVMIRSKRITPEKTSEHVRYFISSLTHDATQLLEIKRAHWGIENGLHWVLDVAFREDESRIRKEDGAENFAILRHIALNLLKQDKKTKVGIKGKRLKAGWDEQYLSSLLNMLSQ